MEKEQDEKKASIFVDPYFRDIQTEIWNHERNKTMKCLIIIACILLVGDLITMARNSSFNSEFIYALIFPCIFAGLGIFARVNPIAAVILSTIVFAGLLIIMLYVFGLIGIFMGFLGKAAIIYLLIRAYNHARDAKQAQTNLALPF